MTWACPNCGHPNLMEYYRCSNCGCSRPSNVHHLPQLPTLKQMPTLKRAVINKH